MDRLHVTNEPLAELNWTDEKMEKLQLPFSVPMHVNVMIT